MGERNEIGLSFVCVTIYCKSVLRWKFRRVYSYEIHAYPISLSEYGTLSKTDKADFLKCLHELQVPSYNGGSITTEAYVADGGAIINMNSLKLSTTYG